MQLTKEQVLAYQAVLYTKGMLSGYDTFILGISNRYIWKCPSSKIEELYNANVSSNHLDVGVGTGYFLNRCKFPSSPPRVVLMDMSANCLEFTSKRIARYKPETYQQNILEKINTAIKPFDSIGVNYLFHCVPGTINDKAVALDHLKAVMNPGGRIFGSTILQGGVPISRTAQKVMTFYNKKGIFANTQDNLADLKTALSQRFNNVTLEVVGCVALFSGHVQ